MHNSVHVHTHWHCPCVLLKECNLFQMLKGSVFLIIDILVKISI